MKVLLRRIATSPEFGLVLVVAALSLMLALLAETHIDRRTGELVNAFWNGNTLMQVATDASFFSIMAVGAAIVIISGGIDLSVGAIYALTGVGTAMLLRAAGPMGDGALVLTALTTALSIGLVCGILNGLLVRGLGVHPFIITLGTMWIFRGIAFVMSR